MAATESFTDKNAIFRKLKSKSKNKVKGLFPVDARKVFDDMHARCSTICLRRKVNSRTFCCKGVVVTDWAGAFEDGAKLNC
ncbi:hypothetical protein Droror1_Dr00021194 [Drosera rotundifolia]